MTVQWSTTLRDALLDQWETTIGTAPKLRIYPGSAPANCSVAASATLIVEFTLDSDWANTAALGVKGMQKGAAPLSGTNFYTATASSSNTAAHYRIYDSAGTNCHEQGTVGTSGADLIIDNTVINSGQVVNITGYTKTAPGA
jgi:hypothetical protein